MRGSPLIRAVVRRMGALPLCEIYKRGEREGKKKRQLGEWEPQTVSGFLPGKSIWEGKEKGGLTNEVIYLVDQRRNGGRKKKN